MSPQQPRRPASSRGVTPRPRKIAGRTSEPVEPQPAEQPVDQPAEQPVDQPVERPVEREALVLPSAEPAADPVEQTAEDSQPTEPTEPGEPKARSASMFAGAGLTRALLVGLVVLVVLALVQGAWLIVHAVRSDDAGPKVAAGQIAVPAGRPVILNQTDVDAAVDQAAQDAVILVKRDYRTYDADVAKAVDLLTDRFAREYKQTSADTKARILADKVNVDAKVVAQGVVRANTTQVQALLFLNQYVTKGTGKNRRVTYVPYKVLLTMIHTDNGWLVDGIDTK